jgi:hypothetical protein
VALAGETIIAGKVPGERIDTEIATSSSSGINTTETVVMTLVFAAVAGRVYKITADFGFAVTDVTCIALATIREDSVSGTVVQSRRIKADSTTSPWSEHIEGEYAADATEDKTIVLTFDRTAGSGDISLAAGAVQASYLYADYVRES